MPAQRVAGDWLARIALAVGAVVATFIACEGGARLFNLQAPFFLNPGPTNCLQRDATLSLSFRPDCHAVSNGTEFSTNAVGLRGPQLKTDGRRRVLALGDSCTWGWQVGQDASYPAVLQSLLAQRPGPPVEVLNAGVPGWTSFQGLTWLRERGLALRPSVVVVGFGFNDMTRAGDIEVRIAEERRRLWLLQADDLLLTISQFYRFLRGIGQSDAPLTAAQRVSPERLVHNLTETIRLSRAQGAQVLLVNFLVPDGTDSAPYVEAMRQVAAATQTPLIQYEGARIDVVHPTARGYQVLAARVADAIAALPAR